VCSKQDQLEERAYRWAGGTKRKLIKEMSGHTLQLTFMVAM
jgi:hypothetical protein